MFEALLALMLISYEAQVNKDFRPTAQVMPQSGQLPFTGFHTRGISRKDLGAVRFIDSLFLGTT
jgi:hypothetical protein